MRYKRALVSGVLGGLVMTILMALGRWIGVPLSFETLLGTAVGIPLGTAAWFVGLALHLGLSAVTGLAYAWGFLHITRRATRIIGFLFGLVHGAVIGVVIGLLPAFHPLGPGPLPDLGFFMSRLGAFGVTATLGLHAAYGTTVGAAYGDVLPDGAMDADAERRERAA